MSSNEMTQMEEGDLKAQGHAQRDSGFCGSPEVVQIIQKIHTLLLTILRPNSSLQN
jgi:hypothetical protein